MPPAILLVEDDLLVRRITARMLDSAGFAVTAAATGREALELLASGATADAIVMDVWLPQMPGPEVARQLWVAQPSLPILFISGYPEPVLHDEGARRLVHAFLPKPFTQDQLVTAVRLLLA